MAAHNRPLLSLIVGAALAVLSATGCLSTSPRVVKIGLVAPFEGRYREIGDQVIAAARDAVREYAIRYPNNGRVIELVAYDDRGTASLAVDQARKLVADPDVAVVIGHWRDETTQAALPVYQKAGKAVIVYSPADLSTGGSVENLSPALEDLQTLAESWAQNNDAKVMVDSGDDALASAEQLTAEPPSSKLVGSPVWGLSQFHALAPTGGPNLYFVTGAAYPADLSDQDWPAARVKSFVTGYEVDSLGAPPGLLSVSAYEATWLAIERIARDDSAPSPISDFTDITFGPDGRRSQAPIYLYEWQGQAARLVSRLR